MHLVTNFAFNLDFVNKPGFSTTTSLRTNDIVLVDKKNIEKSRKSGEKVRKKFTLLVKNDKKIQRVSAVLPGDKFLGVFKRWLHSGLFSQPCSHRVKFAASLRQAVFLYTLGSLLILFPMNIVKADELLNPE